MNEFPASKPFHILFKMFLENENKLEQYTKLFEKNQKQSIESFLDTNDISDWVISAFVWGSDLTWSTIHKINPIFYV